MVGIGMRMGQSLRQTQRLSNRLSIGQYMRIYFGDFISTPKAICPKCGQELNEKDIMAGFSDNPQELRTTCPKCQKKFLANLIIEFQDGEKKQK